MSLALARENPFFSNFLGQSPGWMKLSILLFTIANIFIYLNFSPFILGWVILLEFIFTLATAAKVYPLVSGGILGIQALLFKLTTVEASLDEIIHNFPVIFLLFTMVAAITLMKKMLIRVFMKVFIGVKSKWKLVIVMILLSAVQSAFLDALTVTAVLINVLSGFYFVYEVILKKQGSDLNKDGMDDSLQFSNKTLKEFKSFLSSIAMHSLVGTALGGFTTMVGEPQNLIIAKYLGWDFATFVMHMAPVAVPVLIAGLVTSVVLELTGWFGYGQKMPKVVREVLVEHMKQEELKRTKNDKYIFWIHVLSALFLVYALAFHIAEVGLVGLFVIIIIASLTGVIDEHSLGELYKEQSPFITLLFVFFIVVAMIHDQHLFAPIIDWALSADSSSQLGRFYIANGVLSAISDNVFVATSYISELAKAFESELIDRSQYEKLAVAINAGTNLPSVATPNGQAAFLFFLTSALAPKIGLSYMKMVKMALPYTIVLGIVAYIFVVAL